MNSVHYSSCTLYTISHGEMKNSMLKNITLSAEESLIHRARARAEEEQTTLNAEFRAWLVQYVERPQSAAAFLAFMDELDYAEPGWSFSRDEMNER